MSQHDPLDDLPEPEISTAQVERRVEDWLERLDRLFSSITDWAGENSWSCEKGPPIPMHEELMQNLGVPATEQPTLSLQNSDGIEIWIKPKGLWVIGANGRVDIYSRKGAFALVDTAKHFDPPKWIIHRVGEKEGQPFEPRTLENIV